MKWLRAELEIRGYLKCAKRPEKCKNEVRKILEDCKRGDCFLKPERVIEEAKEVLERGREGISATQLAVGIIVILLIFNLVGLYLFYTKLNDAMNKISLLKKEIDNLKWSVRTNTFALSTVKAKLNELTKEVDKISKSLEAMKIAIFYLNQR